MKIHVKIECTKADEGLVLCSLLAFTPSSAQIGLCHTPNVAEPANHLLDRVHTGNRFRMVLPLGLPPPCWG